jgi:hypothetical protein
VVRLSHLAKMAELPDTDFVLNLGDVPIVWIDRSWLSSRVLHLSMSGAVPLIATTAYRSYWRACEAEAGVRYLPIQPDLSDLEATISQVWLHQKSGWTTRSSRRSPPGGTCEPGRRGPESSTVPVTVACRLRPSSSTASARRRAGDDPIGNSPPPPPPPPRWGCAP